MPDEADIADRFMELSLQASLAARTNLPREVAPIGKCYNCEDDIAPEPVMKKVDGVEVYDTITVDGVEKIKFANVRPFCDQFCRDDYNKRNKRT